MALSNFVKADNTTALNLVGSWVGGSVPNAVTARVQANSTMTASRSAVLGASLTFGQIEVSNPVGLLTIANTASAVLTLTPTDPDAAGRGINILDTATQGLTISNALVTLGADQTWYAGNAKQLTVSGVISGAFNLTKSGNGFLSMNGTNTFGGSGKTFTLANGAMAPTNNAALGSALNLVDIQAGSYIDLTTFTPQQTQFKASGFGTWFDAASPYQRYTAVAFGTFASTKTMTVYGSAVALSMYVVTIAGKITGSVTNTIEFSASVSPAAFNNTTNDFYAPGGVQISSFAISSLNVLNFGYNVGATDAAAGGANEPAPFGDIRNTVRVLPSGRLYAAPGASTTRTVARTISFDGDPANTAIQNASASTTSTLAFSGPLTFSNTAGAVEVLTGGSLISFRKSITGAGGMRVSGGGTRVEFDSTEAGAFSSWSGTITAPNDCTIQYGNGYATLTNPLVTTGAGNIETILNNKLAQDITLAHSSYSFGDDMLFSGTNSGYIIDLGTAPVTGSAGTVYSAATGTTVKMPGDITGQLIFGKGSNGGTIIVSGTNTRSGGVGSTIGWSSGSLHLNSASALGNGGTAADAIVFSGTTLGTLDNTSGSAVTLLNSGVKQLDGNFTWGGTNNLNLGGNNVTRNAARTITFGTGGGTGTLTFPSPMTTTTGTFTLNIGGSTTGAKQRVVLIGASSFAPTSGGISSVTAGYFQIQNSDGLGAAANTVNWYVGMTTGGVATTGAALELRGNISVPNTKNAYLRGTGPNTDGAFRSVSGNTAWAGGLIPHIATLTRFQVDAGTLTLTSSLYPNISPTNASTPLAFTALSGATLDTGGRVLTSNVSTVNINNGGSGTVIFRAANSHVGANTIEGGTLQITNAAALGSASGNSTTILPTATLQIAVPSTYSATFKGTTTFGQTGSTTAANLIIGT
jgi:hypothetical protein